MTTAAQARAALLELRTNGTAWSYRRDGAPSVEPTVLACLGLLGSSKAADDETDSIVRAACDWLVSLQQSDGSLGVSKTLATPNWPTTFAALLWAAVPGYDAPLKKATAWLLGIQGVTLDRLPWIGHDTTIAGWPWVSETHSWVEPTCMAILALRRQDKTKHARTEEGLRMIRDRTIAGGGWNYGNTAVFDTPLRPHPAPTGMALLALAGIDARNDTIDKASRYLQQMLSRTKAARSLCWGLLGLQAWGNRPAESESWLANAFELAPQRSDAALQIAYVLLAAGKHSLRVLGLEAEAAKQGNHNE